MARALRFTTSILLRALGDTKKFLSRRERSPRIWLGVLCQNYLAEPTVAKQYTQQDKWHCKRSVRQDGETIVMREKKGLNPFSPLKTLDYYWLVNIVF